MVELHVFQSIDCTMTNNVQESQQTMVVCHQQWQQPVQLSEMEIEGTIQQNVSQPQPVITHTVVDTGSSITQQPTQLMMNNTQSYEQQAPVAYSQDIDDLMAVLRDDQGNSHIISGCYLCEQLEIPIIAQVFCKMGGASRQDPVKCESWCWCYVVGEDVGDISCIANNGQYAPYPNEPHDSVGGRSTDPMCMPSHSEEGVGDQNMDWLDVMLQNAPIEQRPYGSS
ncbi:hypothetical protein OSTOST_09150 [Ostertagia ostertagi]